MKDLKKLKTNLSEQRLHKWEQIPDIDLYRDQVLSYMKRQQFSASSEEVLTSAMINNYMKKDLLPRAKGKRYDREHIAYLTSICLLKQVLSMTETGILLKDQLEKQDIQGFYKKYCGILDEGLSSLAEDIQEDMSKDELSDLILKLAISSYTQKLACQSLLKIIEEN